MVSKMTSTSTGARPGKGRSGNSRPGSRSASALRPLDGRYTEGAGQSRVQVATQFVRVVVDCDACQMEQRISLVTLGVTDLARARSFYEAMGWGGAQQPDEEVCFFQAGGMVLGLWTALGGHGAPGIELAQNVRAPEEVAVVLAEAEQAGGKIVRPAARAEWGGMSGAFADPDGYVWEVAHNPGWTITDDGSIRI